LPPKNTTKANPKPNAISSASQQQGHLNISGSQTTQTRPTLALFQQPTPTTSVNQTVGADTSSGGQSSRQSNDINESAEQFEAATSEGHTNEGESDGDLVAGKQYVFPSIILSMQYLDLLIL
jgi:hypothetical protein